MGNHERRAPAEGWEWKRLGDVATVGAGNSAPQGDQYFTDGKYPFVRTQDVGREKAAICLLKTKDDINDLAVKAFNLKLWPAKTLLIPKSGESTFLNHRALLGKPSYVSSHLATVMPSNCLLPEYLFFWSLILDSKKLTHDINYPSLRLSELESAKIPLPPLPTQRRIVSILEKAEETKRLRAQADELTDRLLKNMFLEMFGDPVKNPKGWEVERLEAICSEIYRYPTFYGFKYSKNGVPVVRINNIFSNGSLDPNISKYVFIEPSLNKNFPRTILEFNDIVMAVRGDGSTAKRIGLVNTINLVGANISPNLIRFRAKAVILNSSYLFNLMTSYSGQKLLEKYVTRTAKKTITAKDIKEIPIPLPPLPLQQKFARIVEKIDSMRQSQNQSKQQIEDLFSTLMQKAFRGEI